MTDDARKAWQRPGFIIAAVVILLVLALGITALVRSLGQPDQEPTASPTTSTSTDPSAPTETTSPPETTEPTPTEDSVCGLEAVELEGTLDAAPDTSWTYVGFIALPAVEGQGPGELSDSGLRSCFARTPAGAVLAMANFSAQVNVPELREDTFRYFTAQGPGYEAAVANAGPLSEDASGDIAVVGFRLLSYDGSEALVDVALRVTAQGQTVYISARSTAVWQEGDWRWVPAEDGSEQFGTVVLPSIADYVQWAAE